MGCDGQAAVIYRSDSDDESASPKKSFQSPQRDLNEKLSMAESKLLQSIESGVTRPTSRVVREKSRIHHDDEEDEERKSVQKYQDFNPAIDDEMLLSDFEQRKKPG